VWGSARVFRRTQDEGTARKSNELGVAGTWTSNAARVEISGLGGESQVNSATGNPEAGSQSVVVFMYIRN
jgi:hypothetical protein